MKQNFIKNIVNLMMTSNLHLYAILAHQSPYSCEGEREDFEITWDVFPKMTCRGQSHGHGQWDVEPAFQKWRRDLYLRDER